MFYYASISPQPHPYLNWNNLTLGPSTNAGSSSTNECKIFFLIFQYGRAGELDLHLFTLNNVYLKERVHKDTILYLILFN